MCDAGPCGVDVSVDDPAQSMASTRVQDSGMVSLCSTVLTGTLFPASMKRPAMEVSVLLDAGTWCHSCLCNNVGTKLGVCTRVVGKHMQVFCR